LDEIYNQANRRRWNELVPIHARSAFYDVDGFRAGKTSLRPIELGELGDVAGKRLLHLQCHFGLDALSWARLGAQVTGVDYSETAILEARALARQTKLPAEFLVADIHELPGLLSGEFDIVYTSYGAICWIGDLEPWARIVAHFLRAKGTFYMVEIHPFADVWDDGPDAEELRVGYSYFHEERPIRVERSGSYADRQAVVENKVSYTWNHSLGDIVSALAGAGLRIEFLHEFPYCICAVLPGMEQRADGWWYARDPRVPFLFSLKAAK
jgi:SAM-dependent methyltransferase